MSLSSDLFQQLTRGLRFGGASNAAALEARRRWEAKERDLRAARALPSAPAPHTRAATGAALDFFGVGAGAATAPATVPTTVSRKRSREAPTTSLAAARAASVAVSDAASDASLDAASDAASDDFLDDASNDASDAGGAEEESGQVLRASDAATVRKTMRIKVKGQAVPAPMVTYSKEALLAAHGAALPSEVSSRQRLEHLAALLARNVEASQYSEPTAVQMQAVPALLQGRDVLACAPTGSGKTAAFLVPLILRLATPGKGGVRCVVMAPTRELAAQIAREFDKLAAGRRFRTWLLRKETMATAAASLAAAAPPVVDLVVATPERLVQLAQAEGVNLGSCEMLVMDEADKLFEMGFLEQVDAVIAACGPRALRAMFSATMPPQVEQLAASVLRDAVEVSVGTRNAGSSSIAQKLLFVGQEAGKLLAMRQLAAAGELMPPTLVFVQSKERASELLAELAYEGLRVDAIHSDRTQAQRNEAIEKFRKGQVWTLICTDLMGRGIDFKGVNCVVNYDLPTSAVSYIHRIGRTGRAGRSGRAVTFFTLDDVEHLRSIANVVKLSGCDVPEWMLRLKKGAKAPGAPRGAAAAPRRKGPPERQHISTLSSYDRARQARKRNIVAQGKEQQLRKRRQHEADERAAPRADGTGTKAASPPKPRAAAPLGRDSTPRAPSQLVKRRAPHSALAKPDGRPATTATPAHAPAKSALKSAAKRQRRDE